VPRNKSYNEPVVLEKAMHLFWRNGYSNTSLQMLEKEMGINKFSIYASFGSKEQMFLQSIGCYRRRLNDLILKLKESNSGIHGIKTYFYDFIQFAQEGEFGKGCLITNTANEMGQEANEEIKIALTKFMQEIRELFLQSLILDPTKSKETVESQADYLLIAMFGLSSATKVFNEQQLHHYIDNIFKSL
jgi:TetR/AcrR family transcriptional repressor of nem operon